MKWVKFRVLQNLSDNNILSLKVVETLTSVDVSKDIKVLIERKYKRLSDNVFTKDFPNINTKDTYIICELERLEEHELNYLGLKTAYINQKGNLK